MGNTANASTDEIKNELFCFAVYPCPLFSVRFRKPLFGETGHTIMNLLAVSALFVSSCVPVLLFIKNLK